MIQKRLNSKQFSSKLGLALTFIFFATVNFGLSALTAEKTPTKKAEPKKEQKMSNPVVVMDTTEGKIEIELDQKNAPVSTENFLAYVKQGFYDGKIFHRVISNFMIQGGGFDEKMNQPKTMAPIANESKNGLKNLRGTIAMARTSDPASATAQFFINVVDNAFLNRSGDQPSQAGYAVFGKVTSGMDTVDKIKDTPTGFSNGQQDVPKKTIKINSAKIKGA